MANEILAENIAFDENGLYIPQTWLDGVGEGNFTPLTADRMNHIEQGIKGLSDRWDSQCHPTEIGTTSSTTYQDIGSLGEYSYYLLLCMYSGTARILASTIIPREYMLGSTSSLSHTASLGMEGYEARCYQLNGRIYASVQRDSYCRAVVLGIT